jgi:hypothetical protein
MRVRTFAVGAAVAAASVVGLAAPAFAAVHGSGSNSGTFSYTDETFGPVSCHEVHHLKNTTLPAGLPAGATTTGGWDKLHCTSTTGQPLTNVTPGQTGQTEWASDFGSRYDQNTGTLAWTISRNGKAYTGVAWYPNG